MTTLLSTPSTISFASHLAKPYVIDARTGGSYMIHMVQTQVDFGFTELGLTLDPGASGLTTVYAYQLVDSTGQVLTTTHVHNGVSETVPIYNPTFLTASGVPISVTWMNMLPATGGHLLPYDPSIMMGMSMGGTMDPNLIPTVVHLHGAHAASIYDGYPTATLVQMDPNMPMSMGSMDTYTYDNSQQGAVLWYHDHSLGLTRLNVYAGLAGSYMIEDANHKALIAAGILPDTLGANETSLLVADKSFTSDGQLYFPGAAPTDPLPGTADTVATVLPPDYAALGGQFPTAVPEYYGDFITVNGTAWPHMHVNQGDNLVDLVNGSDSRFYTLKLSDANVKVTLVGVDGGLLDKPIVIMDGDGVQEAGEQIIFAPGDRLQLILDFTNVADSTKVQLLNEGAAFEPFKGVDSSGNLRPGNDDQGSVVPVTAATTADSVGQIMEFRVNSALPAWHSAMTPTTVLNPNYAPIAETSATVTRKLGIFEYTDAFGRIMPMVGTAESKTANDGSAQIGALGWDKPVTELVNLGDTEIWEFFNTTADAHPIHVHLGQFQVLGRYQISATDTNGDGVTFDGFNNDFGSKLDMRADLDGIQNLLPEDMGYQDTVWVGPGEALQIIMKFDRPGDFVWHCHILSHEDHDMMRPIKVLGLAGDFIGAINEDATAASLGLLELGKANALMQGFVAGDFAGTLGYGTLHMEANLALGGLPANNGEWSYVVGAAAQALAKGETLTDIVTIHELDGTAHDIKIAVTGNNDAPIVAGVAAFAGTQNVTRTITMAELLSKSSDIDHGAILSVQGLTASGATLLDNGDGTWDLTAAPNSLAQIVLSYTVTDGELTAAASCKIDMLTGVAVTVFTGTAAVNSFLGTAGNDYEDGKAGNDELKGGAGDDRLIGGAGLDQCQGGAGNDWFLAAALDGNDDYAGGVGIDTYSFAGLTAAATVNLATGNATSLETGLDKLNEIENVVGSAAGDSITGNGFANVLSGKAGADTLIGGAGNDTLNGGAGNDILTGGLGNDTFAFANQFGHDTVTDFTVGTALAHDTLDLRGLGFLNFADVIAKTDAGLNAVIHAGVNDITLTGVNVAMLKAWDVLV